MIVTGVTTSRLYEIKKYKTSDVFEENYILYTPSTKTGLLSGSISEGEVIYMIKGIKYMDQYNNDNYEITFFEYTPTPINLNEDGFLIKINNYGKSIDKPIIKKDLFVDRNEFSPFKNNLLIRNMENLIDAGSYIGGNYFNIYKN